ncbi:MAG: sigma-54 dependent transcriptional regulator [Desulfovibrio sp.]|jgi:DNA-binding NtrC family response regulator|nr:sigma-54 dependent transcriptional regulator [Desulfovibrio sp.]
MSLRSLLFLAPPNVVSPFFSTLRDEGFEIGLAENAESALQFVRKSGAEIVFSRPRLPGYDVEEMLAAAAEETLPPIIVIADKGTPEEAERLMHLGAKDYWMEPLDVKRVLAVCKVAPPAAPVPPATSLGGHRPEPGPGIAIVGDHPSVARVLRLARQVARSAAAVLITGESGTGKELFARYLHAESGRQGPFVAVNCAALPEHLLESELFGHEKGAFTGAIARKLGKFELADKGTLLLDEISEMDIGLQAKLLRVLQEREVDRVGGAEAVKVDVRVLATSNRNLEDWVAQGKFRQDLYFRLNVIPMRLPSLRERGDDVQRLAGHFVAMYASLYGLPKTGLSEEAREWLAAYDFPGNIRELQNLMERAVLISNGREIVPAHFLLGEDSWPLFDEEAAPAFGEGAVSGAPGIPGDDPLSARGGPVIPLHEMERIMILKGLEATSGNRTQAAELLGISVRTLRNKINEYRSDGIAVD